MAHIRQTPLGRGYQRFLGYYHHANDYYSESLPFAAIGTVNVCDNKFVDLWLDDGPAHRLNGTAYEPELFANHSLGLIRSHDADSSPLMLFHAFHLVHTPLEVPKEWLEKFAFVDNAERQKISAMVAYMGEVVGMLVAAFKAQGMWDNTLAIFVADNGGAIYFPAGGNVRSSTGGCCLFFGCFLVVPLLAPFVPGSCARAHSLAQPGLLSLARALSLSLSPLPLSHRTTHSAVVSTPTLKGASGPWGW